MRSVSEAISGLKGSTDNVVMMLSRPNKVANHGMPAIMKVPSAAREMSEFKSACERFSSESKSSLLAVSVAQVVWESAISDRRAANALSKLIGCPQRPCDVLCSSPPVMRASSATVSSGARFTTKAARPPLSARGLAPNATSVKRLTPSSPS